MPNWCYNHMTMTKKDYLANKHLFITELFNEEDKSTEICVDFNILLPEPMSVIADSFYNRYCFDFNTGGFLTNDTRFLEIKDDFTKQTFNTLTPDFFNEMIGERQVAKKNNNWDENDGFYFWHCNNWDTKWNASETYLTEDLDDLEDEELVNIHFQTAWSCPHSFYVALAKHCNFSCDGEEESNAYIYEGEAMDGEFDISVDEDPPALEDEEDYEDE